jgi:hypothetical protein
MGADISRSTLADWCGRSMRTLQPVIDGIDAAVLGSDILHADDTPIRVLAPERRAKGIGKGVMQGRMWGYVCDQRPWAGTAPPGVVYRYAPNWSAQHVQDHLRHASGILQADAYKGYAKLYEPAADGDPPRQHPRDERGQLSSSRKRQTPETGQRQPSGGGCHDLK